MAQVAPRPDSDSVASWFLNYLHGFWTMFPEFAAEWDDWDEDSRITFLLDWPLMVEKVRRVEQADQSGELSPSQRRLWTDVQRLMETHRAEMEAMLGHPL